MPLTRRQAIAGCGGGLAWLAALPAKAQAAYPSRTIKMIVPYPAGGTTDLLGRMVADQFKSGLGATVVVENKPGAGTNIAAAVVATAAPDGYTFYLANFASHSVNRWLYKSMTYDPATDFEPVAMLSNNPVLIVARKTMPADDLKGLIAWLKANPDKAAQGTAGVGSVGHLGGVLFKNLADTRFQHVPYRGAAPAMQDLVAG